MWIFFPTSKIIEPNRSTLIYWRNGKCGGRLRQTYAFPNPGEGGGTPYNGLYGEATPERGTFFTNLVLRAFSPACRRGKGPGKRGCFFTLQVNEREAISRVQVYKRVRKPAIHYELFKRAFHWNNTNTHTLCWYDWKVYERGILYQEPW